MHRGSNNDSPGRWRRDSMEQFLSYLKAWDIKREREREREKKRENNADKMASNLQSGEHRRVAI